LKKVSFSRPKPHSLLQKLLSPFDCSAIRWDHKQVWKGLGYGEGKNLSLKGFHFPGQNIKRGDKDEWF
jgi:hypothetical protein